MEVSDQLQALAAITSEKRLMVTTSWISISHIRLTFYSEDEGSEFTRNIHTLGQTTGRHSTEDICYPVSELQGWKV
jgi:hypothetical protein